MIRWILLLLFAAFANQVSGEPAASTNIGPVKVITITVSSYGMAYMGRDTMVLADLAKELRSRLWKSYLGTGKMQDAIKVEFTGDVPKDTKETATAAVQEGQKMALKDICLQKHKQYFENLGEKQQAKIRKQFPVLFQTGYLSSPGA